MQSSPWLSRKYPMVLASAYEGGERRVLPLRMDWNSEAICATAGESVQMLKRSARTRMAIESTVMMWFRR